VGQRITTTAIGVALAASLGLAPVHNAAAAVPPGARALVGGPAGSVYAFAKKKKKKKKAKKPDVEEDPDPKITPESADGKRNAIRGSVQGARDSGDWESVASGLEKNAPLLGDPVTMLEAGEARVEAAAKQRSVEQAELAIEDTRIALDILHFYDAVSSGAATSSWHVIAPGDAAALIERGDAQIERAESLISEIEAEKVAAAGSKGKDDGDDEKKKKKKKKRNKGDKAKPGTGMIAAGSVFTVVGVAGLAMVIVGTVRSSAAQKEVEKLDPNDPDVDTYDKIGKQSNIVAYAGAGLAVAGFAVGLPLLIVGVKRRKQAGDAPASASVQRRNGFALSPMLGAGTQGLVIRGRF
jgi:hypothetical protein